MKKTLNIKSKDRLYFYNIFYDVCKQCKKNLNFYGLFLNFFRLFFLFQKKRNKKLNGQKTNKELSKSRNPKKKTKNKKK